MKLLLAPAAVLAAATTFILGVIIGRYDGRDPNDFCCIRAAQDPNLIAHSEMYDAILCFGCGTLWRPTR